MGVRGWWAGAKGGGVDIKRNIQIRHWLRLHKKETERLFGTDIRKSHSLKSIVFSGREVKNSDIYYRTTWTDSQTYIVIATLLNVTSFKDENLVFGWTKHIWLDILSNVSYLIYGLRFSILIFLLGFLVLAVNKPNSIKLISSTLHKTFMLRKTLCERSWTASV